MPGGASILLVREVVHNLLIKKIISVRENTKIDQSRLRDKKVNAFKTWENIF